MTLLFLGNISVQQQISLQAAALAITIPEITINFNRLSFWKNPGILCLTIAEPNAELQFLADRLADVAKQLMIKIDNRPFKPHITLVRHAHELAQVEFEPILWRSHSFCLAQSSTGNLAYEIIQQWPSTW